MKSYCIYTIYNKKVLDNTVQALSTVSSVDTVLDVRALIDDVYADIQENQGAEIKAGMRMKGSMSFGPYNDSVTILDKTESAYHEFDRLAPQTRDEGYPSTSVVILPEWKDIYDYEDMKKIMNENVINSVPVKKLEPFLEQKIETDIKWFKDIYVFVSPTGVINEGMDVMSFTEEGLEFS